MADRTSHSPQDAQSPGSQQHGSQPAAATGGTHAAQIKASLHGHDYATQIQMLAPAEQTPRQTPDFHAAAAHGVSGSAGALPHKSAIQSSFGGYDISNVQAHTDPAAQAGAAAMGADAYATGNHVAFGAGATSLHTAAHEAAHVVQQKAGVQLKSGVGEVGDRYEQHADAVADRVVQGKSAEDLLHAFVGPSDTQGVEGAAVQQDAVQRQAAPAGQQAGATPAGAGAGQQQRAQALRTFANQTRMLESQGRTLANNALHQTRNLQAADDGLVAQAVAWASGAGSREVRDSLRSAETHGDQAIAAAQLSRRFAGADNTDSARRSFQTGVDLIELGYRLINEATDSVIGSAEGWQTGLEITKTTAFTALEIMAAMSGMDPVAAGAMTSSLDAAASWVGGQVAEGDGIDMEDVGQGVLQVGGAATFGAITGGVGAGTAGSSMATQILANGAAGAMSGAGNNVIEQVTSGGSVDAGQVVGAAVSGGVGGAVGGAFSGASGGASAPTPEALQQLIDHGVDPRVIRSITRQSQIADILASVVTAGSSRAVDAGIEVAGEMQDPEASQSPATR